VISVSHTEYHSASGDHLSVTPFLHSFHSYGSPFTNFSLPIQTSLHSFSYQFLRRKKKNQMKLNVFCWFWSTEQTIYFQFHQFHLVGAESGILNKVKQNSLSRKLKNWKVQFRCISLFLSSVESQKSCEKRNVYSKSNVCNEWYRCTVSLNSYEWMHIKLSHTRVVDIRYKTRTIIPPTIRTNSFNVISPYRPSSWKNHLEFWGRSKWKCVNQMASSHFTWKLQLWTR